MKTSHQILIIAAVGAAAYLLLAKPATAGTVGTRTPAGGVNPLNPYNSPYLPGYVNPNIAAQQRNQLDNTTNSLLYGAGRLINGWFGGSSSSSSPSSGGGTSGGGVWRPSTYDNAQPDSFAVNTPYQATPWQATDATTLYDNNGYGEAWAEPTEAQTLYGDIGYGSWD